MATLARAIQIAVQAHQTAFDKSENPYILHPLSVMARVKTEPEKIVAILHDVVEDSVPPNRWGMDELRNEGFSDAVLAALDCVTKRDDEPYEAFILRSMNNPIARAVKIADLEDNLDVRRLKTITEKDCARLNKYLKAWRTLTSSEACFIN